MRLHSEEDTMTPATSDPTALAPPRAAPVAPSPVAAAAIEPDVTFWIPRRIRLARIALGLLLVIQGLAHAAAGTWASASVSPWFVTPTWAAAMLGFVAAGLGLLGIVPLRARWRTFLVVGAIGSMLLLGGVLGPPLFALGMAVDLALVLTVLEWHPFDTFGREPHVVRHPRLQAVAGALALLFLAFVGAAVLLRPWHTTWGTTPEERRLRLPGDQLVPDARYRMDHAITIAAPADSVWPWLVQVGQDRGGFYSYAWLERLIGDEVTNADRIHPEWQHREVGDLVRAAQPDYLGGMLGSDLGWRVVQIVPGRALVLENWGAFVVRPQDDGTTRLHIRLRGEGRPSLAGVLLGPANLLVFEPAHFVMERGMLRGIKARAGSTCQRRRSPHGESGRSVASR